MTERYTPIAGVLGVLERGGLFLIQRRSPTNYFAPNCYGLPGGHFEPDEDAAMAVARECGEELGIRLDPTHCTPIGTVFELRDGEPARIHYVCHITEWEGDPAVAEPAKHSDVLWVASAQVPERTLLQAKAAIELVLTRTRYRVIQDDPLTVSSSKS